MSTDFFVLGLNHRIAGIDVRERFSLNPDRQQLLLERLLASQLAEEAVVLSTCNRIEIYGAATRISFQSAQILQVLSDVAGNPERSIAPFYFHQGQEALEHLFRVTSSMDSQIVGEAHILGQVKEAYERSRAAGATARGINRAFQKAFQVAKKVRSETNIAALPVSTGSCAVALAKRIFEDPQKSKVLLVGAGEIARNVAQHFVKQGAELTVSNRTRDRAEALAGELEARAIDFSIWDSRLLYADIVVFATSCSEPLLTYQKSRGVMHDRKNKPLLLLDLSIPRNVDPRVGQIESVFLYDIDKVQKVVEAHCAVRLREAEKAEDIVTAAARSLWEKLTSAPGVTTTKFQEAELLELRAIS